MPFPRPTLSDLRGQAKADIATAIPGADPLLRFSSLGILGDVLAAMVNGNYGFLDWIAQQAVPYTATGEYLEAWAALKGVIRKPATMASGSATFTGVNGSLLSSGLTVVRGDGRTYQILTSGTVSSGSVTVPILDTEVGAAGDAASGVLLTLGSAVAGIASTGAAAGPLTGGADVETDAALRTRMLQVYRAPAQGGDLADYVTWALEVPGVTRAWNGGVALGAGTVQIFVMFDVTESAYGGFPQGTNGVAANETRASPATGDQLQVANYIYPLRPVTALVYVYAPIANPVAFTIAGLTGASSAVRAAIAAAITQVLFDTAAPGGVTDPSGHPIGIVRLSDIEAAIGNVAGTEGFTITAMSCPDGTISPSPVGNITSNAGYLATLGAITYV